MNASDWAAWWGAATGTLALGWEMVVHFRKGPRLKIKGWFHPDPHSGRALLHVEVRNTGDEPTRIEKIDVAQDGRKFEPADFISIDSDGAPTRSTKYTVEPNDRVVYQLHPFDRAKTDPPTRVRLLDGRKPAVAYVTAAAFEKAIAAKVRPLDS